MDRKYVHGDVESDEEESDCCAEGPDEPPERGVRSGGPRISLGSFDGRIEEYGCTHWCQDTSSWTHHDPEDKSTCTNLESIGLPRRTRDVSSTFVQGGLICAGNQMEVCYEERAVVRDGEGYEWLANAIDAVECDHNRLLEVHGKWFAIERVDTWLGPPKCAKLCDSSGAEKGLGGPKCFDIVEDI